jgi:hypothetical protein
MTRIMGDSVDPQEIPKTVDLIATYVDGHFGVLVEQLLEELFPSDHYFHVLIDVNGSRPDVNVRDWENGDKAGNLEQWVIDHNNHTGKKDAVIYCNVSTIPEVRRLTGLQVLGEDYFLWVATLDGQLFQGPGVIACQNRGANLNGANFDTSVVFDDSFWTVKTPSPPVPPTTPVAVPTPKPDCRAFQRAIRVAIDNIWGPDTDEAADALVMSWSNEFPHGVAFAQHVVGTRADDIWGPVSKEARNLTTASVQRAFIAMGYSPGKVDGVWGPHTNNAFMAARKACHI